MSADSPLKTTPLIDWHRAAGAKLVDFAGWEMPVQYPEGILAEHLAVRRHGGLFDVSHMGRFRISGPDLIPFLQHTLTGNCQALEPWKSQYTIIPNETGGAIDDAFLYRFGEEEWILVVNASNKDKDWNHLSSLARDFNVCMVDVTAETALIAVQGPLTRDILARVAGAGGFPEARQNNLSRMELCGVDCLLSRTGYTGEPNSFEIFVPAEEAEQVMDGVYQAGREDGLVPVGLGARDTLRLEAGMPLYGHELGGLIDDEPRSTEIPIFAVGLAPVAVSFSPLKGDFIGRAALAEQFEALQRQRRGDLCHNQALPYRIQPLAVLDRGIIRQGYPVYQGERKVGVVTSGTATPYWVFEGEGAMARPTGETGQRSIALAWLEADILPETELEVAVRKRRLKTMTVKYHGRSEAPPYFRALPVGWQKPVRDPADRSGRSRMEDLVSRSLANHRWRQTECLNLIPSEQTVSPLVRLLSMTDPSGRYAEHNKLVADFEREVFYYQGTDFIAWVEDRLAAEMAAYLGCEQVEVRPISGQMANMTVFSALVSWKNRTNLKTEPQRIGLALTHDIGKGGHLSAQPMGALRDYIAKDPFTERFAVVNFPVLADNPYQVDLEATTKLLDECRPELIVFGRSMILHREPVAQVRALYDDAVSRPRMMYDMAHVLGLVGPHFQHPFAEGADLVTGSTHKTFFGTQRGVVGANLPADGPEYELWEAIQRRAFPGMVSNHHLGSLLGLLASAMEMNAFKDDYQPQVIANAKALARSLASAGVKVCGDPANDYTQTHQVVVEVGYGLGPAVARELEDNNIIVNYQALPSDEGFTASSGLRLGVAEMTRFGMKEADMENLAELMAGVIVHGRKVKDGVKAFRGGFTRIGYCFTGGDLDRLTEKLLAAL